ncbi:MAG: hypothetical protein ACFFG0_09555 [Candidatus Thorarchaeota archaeon]
MLSYPRLMLIIGLILLFISLFLEWYSFQVVDNNNELIASWSYSLFFEWTTELPQGIAVNEDYRPLNLGVPLYLTILFMGMMILSGAIVVIRDLDTLKDSSNMRYITYIFGFLLTLTFFYIVLFPVIYLFSNELYFPVVTIIDTELNTTTFYSIGLGYIIHLIGFVFIFPYSLYSILRSVTLEKTRHLPEIHIEKIIRDIQEPLDLDECIAEEELRKGG